MSSLQILHPAPRSATGVEVNDVHSKLNRTRVHRIDRIRSVSDIVTAIKAAAEAGQSVCVAGGRHAMGGQQFAAGARLLDTAQFNRVLALDTEAGIVRVQAGIQWPELIDSLHTQQAGDRAPWGIVQKQTGADRLSIGGAVAANIHGRGLTLRPFIQDIESLELVDAHGELRRCARDENAALFKRVVGGYGLFGVVATVSLRLQRRHALERVVTLENSGDLMTRFDARIAAGFRYGDFQFAIDPHSDDFLTRGVFSCYRPIDDECAGDDPQRALNASDWQQLLTLAHTDKTSAFDHYAKHYLQTSGQRYCSDRHQLSLYLDDYHEALDATLGTCTRGSEVISELYVPRRRLHDFMLQARETLRARKADVIYGTVRLIERDDESLLAWAREDYACIIINLHVDHTQNGRAKAAADFQALFDDAIALGGSFFLTYHRWARRDQVLAAHPALVTFLRDKRSFDPEERYQSDWYRHYRRMFAAELGLV